MKKMQVLWRIGLLAACAGIACSRGSVVRPEPVVTRAPAPSVLLPPATDLTGSWATGTGSEPASATIKLYPSCTYNPAAWIIEQKGNELEAWVFPESYNQGIAVKGPGPARTAASPGWISGNEVSIDDGQDLYVLRYDAESQHLRGTRNGNSFWAARQAVVRTEACPGVP